MVDLHYQSLGGFSDLMATGVQLSIGGSSLLFFQDRSKLSIGGSAKCESGSTHQGAGGDTYFYRIFVDNTCE